MSSPLAEFLNASEAARRLGVSTKALRIYEQHGLVSPGRTMAGWRAYGPDEMTRAGEIVALRALGLSLAQVARVLKGQAECLEAALATHEGALANQVSSLNATIEKVRRIRSDLARGQAPIPGQLANLLGSASEFSVTLELPWPWGGEQFELGNIRPLNYIVGPLGSGKTRLALRLAETLPNATFLGLDRLSDDGAATRALRDDEPSLKSRVDQILAWLVDEGATPSDALTTLLIGLESVGLRSNGPAFAIVDMVEEGLDQATQEALITHLRQHADNAGRSLFLMTRSSSILELAAVGPSEAIVFCPANHSIPMLVAPHPGAVGYEALATCLAPPEVRARTAGVIAWRPAVA